MPAEPKSTEPNVPIAFMVIGSEMVSFTLVGWLIDYLMGTMPGFTIGLTRFGFATVFFQLVRLSRLASKKKPTREREDRK
jgi:F0F1-type ATP synthase assembly protein I